MAGTHGVTVNEGSELSQLIAGSQIPIMKEITLKANCGDLDRGAVLEIEDAYTWKEVATAANAAAILAQDIDNDESNTQKAQAYFVGKYRLSDLVWPDSFTPTNKRDAVVAMQSRGIIIDDIVLAIPTTTTTVAPTTTTVAEEATTTTAAEEATTTTTAG